MLVPLMARSVAKHSGEIDFELLHPTDRAPLCDICEQIAFTVFQSSCCGAYFCKICKDANFRSTFTGTYPGGRRTCPKCQGELGQVNYDFNETQKRNQFEVCCRNKRTGCPQRVQIGLMSNHILSCLYEVVSCKHEKCTRTVLRKDLQNHQKTCPDRILQCQHCKANLRAVHLEHYHLQHCQYFPKDCPNKCGEQVTDSALSKHRETCPHEPIRCRFTKYGCNETVERTHMNQHLSESTGTHMELLLQEIETSHAKQSDMQQTIRSLQMQLEDSYKTQALMRETVQELKTKVESLQHNYSRMVLNDIGRLQQSQKDLDSRTTQVDRYQQQLTKQVDQNFQIHKKAVENVTDECRTIQDSITQASTTFPLRFVINNIEELTCKEEGHLSPYFYTECRRHKLRLTVFPGGKGESKGRDLSLWLCRINNYGVQSKNLPEHVKIQVVIELVNQLPHANEADNYLVTIDAVVHQNQQDELIGKKDDFIPIVDLDHNERRRRFSFVRFTQYKMNNCLVFSVKSAIENTL